MTLTISARPARYIAVMLITMRTFIAMTLDGHAYFNSGWVCILLGGLIALPIALVIGNITIPRHLMGILALYMAYQAAVLSRVIVNSVSYTTLQSTPPLIMSAALFAICLYCTLKNGSSIGNGMKLWFIALYVLLAIILLGSLKLLQPRWLTPVFGAGFPQLAEGALSSAGHMSMGLMLLSSAEERDRNSGLKVLITSVLASCVLCLYWSMLSPIQPQLSEGRLSAIRILLSGGRASLIVLIPMAFAWLMGLIAATAGYSFASALFMQKLLTNINGRFLAVIMVSLALLCANLGLAESWQAIIGGRVAYAAAVIIVVISWAKGARYHAKN